VNISATLRANFWRALFFGIVGAGLVCLYVRLTQGLGAVTNLSDRYPWGLWTGFKISGVMLAGGGFVVTSLVYIFDTERFRPLARPAITTAFLGYLTFVTALLCDLGKPWTIWHPIVMWNPHSVMFEVAWCVTLYTSVLALEFSSMVFERLKWHRAARWQHTVTVPLVIAGAVLSTLHQSSLGSLYLIVPGKLHALWYTPLLPVLFFVSAVAAGLAMVLVVNRFAVRIHGRGLEPALLVTVSRVMVGTMLVYGMLRLGDLEYRGQLGAAFSFSYESCLFLVEFGLGLVLPLLLMTSSRLRNSPRMLYGIGLATVLGFIAHRLNVSMTGFEGAQGGRYMPAPAEALIALMFTALAFAGFTLAVRYFNVYPALEPAPEEGEALPFASLDAPAPTAQADVLAPSEQPVSRFALDANGHDGAATPPIVAAARGGQRSLQRT